MTKVSLIFDDGFAKSAIKTSEIFEQRGLAANFAVLVDSSNIYPDTPKGDFDLWNKLQESGHTIHPHGYDHTDLTQIPFEEAKLKIDTCLEYFSNHLIGFNPLKTTYHLTYNKSTPQVDQYLLSKVKAIRTTGLEGHVGSGMNNEKEINTRRFNCSWHGPDYCDDHLLKTLKNAEVLRPNFLMYMLHGIDDEGWGPIHANSLEKALDYINASPILKYVNADNLI